MTETIIVDVRRLITANKAIAAGLTTLLGALAAVAYSWIVTGGLDWTETRTALGGLVLALVTALATWLTSSGPALIEAEPFPEPYSKKGRPSIDISRGSDVT